MRTDFKIICMGSQILSGLPKKNSFLGVSLPECIYIMKKIGGESYEIKK